MTVKEDKEFIKHLKKEQSGAIIKQDFILGEHVVYVHLKSLISFIEFLKTDKKCQFTQLLDICGADYPDRREDRFEVVYNFLSMKLNKRIRIKVAANEKSSVDSLTSLYSSAGWYERETFDLYGIKFEGHPDLRRILTDYGFEGHPLRKDFPLTGFTEIRYDEDKKKIVHEPVELMQDYRNFDFMSPWEAMTSMQEAGSKKDCKPKLMGERK